MNLNWKNLHLSVDLGDKKTDLLKGVSGFANPREILAIMGVSGSGKTSLLSVLSNKVTIQSSYTLSGNLCLNGVPYSKTHPDRFIRYLPQEDYLLDFLTPREIFQFFGILQCDLTPERMTRKVNQIIQELKLDKVADSIVGNSIVKGLSGGEKKRVSIGQNLIADPSILILDEPTSGLDSFIALNVIQLIKNMCKYGITIIMTIHQPSSAILALIDRLIIMQEGHFVYQGRTQDSIQYFEKIGFPVPIETLPTDYFIKLMNIHDRQNLSEYEEMLLNKFDNNYKSNESEVWNDMIISNLPDWVYEQNGTKLSWMKTYTTLIWRMIVSIRRNPIVLWFKVVQAIGIGFFFASAYRNMGYDGVGMENRYGAMIFCLIDLWFFNAILYSLFVSNENEMIIKDCKNHLYSINTYLLSILSIEIILGAITSTIFSLIVYWICDFNNESSSKFFIFLLISYILLLLGAVHGFFIASFSQKLIYATFFGPTLVMILSVFGCIFTDPETINNVFRWLEYCSPVFFIRRAMYKNEYEDLDYDDDVYPKPKDRFDQEGEIYENILLTLAHCVIYYVLTLAIFALHTRKKGIDLSHDAIREESREEIRLID